MRNPVIVIHGFLGARLVQKSTDMAIWDAFTGMSVNPSYGFADAPAPDVLIIPGGHVIEQQNDADVIAWIRAKADNAEQVLTVCNGAFILASTGLLDGLKATTFYGLLDELAKFAPKVEVVSDQRYVDNGKIITSAGLVYGTRISSLSSSNQLMATRIIAPLLLWVAAYRRRTNRPSRGDTS